MKNLLILFIIMVFGGCAYRPSHSLLVENGFVIHHPGNSKSFDVYTYKCNDITFNDIVYYPYLRRWTLTAGQDGYTLNYIQFTIDSKKEFYLLMQDFK